MTDLTQNELDIIKAKAKIFDMIKEREQYLNKANELQTSIQKCVAELENLEKKNESTKTHPDMDYKQTGEIVKEL